MRTAYKSRFNFIGKRAGEIATARGSGRQYTSHKTLIKSRSNERINYFTLGTAWFMAK